MIVGIAWVKIDRPVLSGERSKLPGYNHYSDCQCGWCVKQRGGKIRIDFRMMDAVAFLERDNVRSLKQCYVNTNATCPQCRARVYFYANRFGSRVFFDDLGPPWPKHGCTNNPDVSSAFNATEIDPPKQRPRGNIIELVEAARTSRMAAGKIFGVRRNGDWNMAVINSIQRQGNKNFIIAEFLDSTTHEFFKFLCLSNDEIFSTGNLIHIRKNEICFLDPNLLNPAIARCGEEISTVKEGYFCEPLNTPTQTDSRVPVDQVLIPRSKEFMKPPKIKGVKFKKNDRDLRSELTEKEAIHFGKDKQTFNRLIEKFDPIIRQYATEGIRNPREVAERLRAEGRRTMAGALWSPRLANFLLKLVFHESTLNEASPKASPSTGLAKLPSVISWEEKLAHLGRVTTTRQTSKKSG